MACFHGFRVWVPRLVASRGFVGIKTRIGLGVVRGTQKNCQRNVMAGLRCSEGVLVLELEFGFLELDLRNGRRVVCSAYDQARDKGSSRPD